MVPKNKGPSPSFRWNCSFVDIQDKSAVASLAHLKRCSGSRQGCTYGRRILDGNYHSNVVGNDVNPSPPGSGDDGQPELIASTATSRGKKTVESRKYQHLERPANI
jgi:hypothetical protein